MTRCKALLAGVAAVATLNPLPRLGAQTVLIGAGIRNGDFDVESAGTDALPFAEVSDWTNLQGNQATQSTRNNLPLEGRNAVGTLDDTRLYGNDTGHTIGVGDVFNVGYWWRDAFNWNDNLDQVEVILFVTDDDTITGTPTVVATDLSGLSTTDSAYEQVDHDGFHTAGAAEAGRRLFVQFRGAPGNPGDTAGYYRLDSFELTVDEGADPKLVIVDSDFTFGDLFHATPAAQTTRTVTFGNVGETRSLTIDSIALTDDAGGIFSLISAPAGGTVVDPGATFEVQVAATGGGGYQSYRGEIFIDVSHAGDPGNDQDQGHRLSARIATTGDPFLLVENPGLDDQLAGWTGGAVPVAGLVSANGARLRGAGDDPANPLAIFADNLGQAFVSTGSPDFTLGCRLAIPDFDVWTGFPPEPTLYDRSFHLVVLADPQIPDTAPLDNGHNASALINLFYFPAGTSDGTTTTPAGFHLYDGASGTFVHLPELGTLLASADDDRDGALDGPTDTPNIYRLTIEGSGFGTGGASYSISISDPNSDTVAGTAAGLTTFHGASIFEHTPQALVFTTNDSGSDSVTNPEIAYQPSFWVDEVVVSNGQSLPLALMTLTEPPTTLRMFDQSVGTLTFTVRNSGIGSDLAISNPVFGDPRLALLSPTLPTSLPPGGSLVFEVQADASTTTTADDIATTLTLDTNDATSPAQSVDLRVRVLKGGELLLVDHDDGIPGNGIHEESIRDGGFEESTAGQTFLESPWWSSEFPEGDNVQLVDDSDPAGGLLHGLTGGWSAGGTTLPRRQAAQVISPDEWTLAAWDSFQVMVSWKDGPNFDTSSTPDQLQVIIEVRDGNLNAVNDPDNAPSGNLDRLLNTNIDLAAPGEYQTDVLETIQIPPGSRWIGHRPVLRLLVIGPNNARDHLALIDNVTLVGRLGTEPIVISDFVLDRGAGGVTLRWNDVGRAYMVQSAPDLMFGDGTVEIQVDGADYVTHPGEVLFQFTDPAISPAPRFWRVSTR